MDPLTGAMIVGGVGAAANYFGARSANANNYRMFSEGNAFNSRQAAIDRDFNARMMTRQRNYQMQLNDQAFQFNSGEAEKQRAYEERMSSTAIQRAAADAEAAGFNKMLPYMKGAAASTPGGATASGSSGSASGASASGARSTSPNASRNTMEGVASTALEAAQLGRERKQTESTISLNSAQEKSVQATAANVATDTKIKSAELEAVKAKTEFEKELYKKKSQNLDMEYYWQYGKDLIKAGAAGAGLYFGSKGVKGSMTPPSGNSYEFKRVPVPGRR